MSKVLLLSDFEPHVGAQFDVSWPEPESSVPLTLLEAVPIQRSTDGRSFALRFDGPAEPLLPQQIHELLHPDQGPLQLFLVPVVGARPGRLLYEAIFSRL